MKIHNVLVQSAAALMLSAMPTIASAATTIDFSGTVLDAGGTGLAAGTTFNGNFTYDESAAPRTGSDPVSAVYDALSSFNLDLVSGGTTYSFVSTGSPEIQIGNLGSFGSSSESTDRFALVVRSSDGLNGPTIGGSVLQTFILRLDDSAGTVFGPANGGLPTSLTFANFDGNGVFLFFNDGAAFGNVTSLSGAVPEPASWALMIVGFGLVGGALRRRSGQAALA